MVRAKQNALVSQSPRWPIWCFCRLRIFSMCTDLIRCAGAGHLMVDIFWKKIGIWMGQLKVKVIHASVTQKCWAECKKTMCTFGLDCVKLSGYSGYFHKTSTVRCPVPAHLIKSMHIEKNSQSTKTSYGSSRGLTIDALLKK